MDTLTNDLFSTLSPTSSTVIDNAISSPASADGPRRSSSQVSTQTPKSGPDHVRVNLSARQAGEAGLLTSGTYGQPSIGLSTSTDLTWSLENKLQAALHSTGSIMYRLTWKAWVMPSGRVLFRRAASVRRTSGSGRSGWPTPAAQEAGGTPEQFLARKVKARENGASLGVSLTSLSLMVQTVSGPPPTGSPAETASIDLLNPAHSRWLMGYPPEWDACGVTAMQSFRKSRRNS